MLNTFAEIAQLDKRARERAAARPSIKGMARPIVIMEHRKDKHAESHDTWEGMPVALDDKGRVQVCDGPYQLFDILYNESHGEYTDSDQEETWAVVGRLLGYIERGAERGQIFHSAGSIVWYIEEDEQ